MAALASTDVTITWSDSAASPKPGDIWVEGRKRKALCTIAFGNGAKTYPANGIPLPDKGNFGMIRSMEAIRILTGQFAGIVWDYDATNHKLKGYTHTHDLRVALTSADAEGARVQASGVDLWVSEPAEGGSDFVVPGLTSDATTHGGVESVEPGTLAELAATVAPAATSLKIEVTGW